MRARSMLGAHTHFRTPRFSGGAAYHFRHTTYAQYRLKRIIDERLTWPFVRAKRPLHTMPTYMRMRGCGKGKWHDISKDEKRKPSIFHPRVAQEGVQSNHRSEDACSVVCGQCRNRCAERRTVHGWMERWASALRNDHSLRARQEHDSFLGVGRGEPA